MDLSLAAVVYIGAAPNRRARSALPDAPVVAHRGSDPMSGRVDHFRKRIASMLHRVAWAIEPLHVRALTS